jgi:hypothetical protein
LQTKDRIFCLTSSFPVNRMRFQPARDFYPLPMPAGSGSQAALLCFLARLACKVVCKQEHWRSISPCPPDTYDFRATDYAPMSTCTPDEISGQCSNRL